MYVPYYHPLYISENVFRTNIKHKYSLYVTPLGTLLPIFYPRNVKGTEKKTCKIAKIISKAERRNMQLTHSVVFPCDK